MRLIRNRTSDLRMTSSVLASVATAFLVLGGVGAEAAEPKSFLEGVRRHSMVTSTVPANGDQNPYAIVIAPVTAGKVQAGDVLVDNFNDRNNLQGLGSTI